jgi:hypothetical protein
MKFTFTDKPSYLAWRAQWKADYLELSQTIRAWKRTRKEFIRRYERTMTPNGPSRTLIGKEPNPHRDDQVRYASPSTATFMLEQLIEAKALSWSLKLAAKAAASAAA